MAQIIPTRAKARILIEVSGGLVSTIAAEAIDPGFDLSQIEIVTVDWDTDGDDGDAEQIEGVPCYITVSCPPDPMRDEESRVARIARDTWCIVP